MLRQWTDGRHDDVTRACEIAREAAHASRIAAEARDLKLVNEWLALQLECPWRIESYRAAPAPERRAMRAAA